MNRDIVVNVGFTALKSLVLFYSISLASKELIPAILGIVLLFRRQAAVWGSCLLLGQSQTILKFNHDTEDNSLYYVALIVCTFLIAFLIIPSNLFAENLTFYFFESNEQKIYHYFSLYLVAVMINYIAYSSWMSEQKFIHANLTELFSLGLVFVFSIFLFSDSVEKMLLFNAVTASMISFMSLAFYVKQFKKNFTKELWITLFNIKSYLVVSLKFGVPRGISSFLDGAIYLVGPWILAGNKDISAALIIGLTFIKMLQVMMMPVSQVISLRIQKVTGDKFGEEIKILQMAALSIVISLFSIIFYSLFKVTILELWLGGGFDHVMQIIDDFLFIIPGLTIFYLLRNYVDLNYNFPYTLISFIAWFFIFFLVYKININWLNSEAEVAVTQAMQFAFCIFYLYSFLILLPILKRKYAT